MVDEIINPSASSGQVPPTDTPTKTPVVAEPAPLVPEVESTPEPVSTPETPQATPEPQVVPAPVAEPLVKPISTPETQPAEMSNPVDGRLKDWTSEENTPSEKVFQKEPLKIFGHAIPGFIPPPASFMAWMRGLSLASKRAKRQEKLDRLMTLFAKHKQIKNDQVEKFLHISDKTTQRYLTMLIAQGKIKRLNSGPDTCYEKI